MGVVESMKFPVGNIQQLLAVGMFYFRVDRMGNLQCLCSRTFRIAEHMQLADIQAVDEVAGILEELVRFAACPDNHVHPDKSVGHDFLNLLNLMTEKGRVVTASHQFQHLVASAL